MKTKERHSESGVVLGAAIMSVVGLLFAGAVAIQVTQRAFLARHADLLAGVGLQIAGVVFVLSFFFEHKSFLFRGIMWFCENVPDFGDDDYWLKPKGRGMAFVYFLILFGLGTGVLIKGLYGK